MEQIGPSTCLTSLISVLIPSDILTRRRSSQAWLPTRPMVSRRASFHVIQAYLGLGKSHVLCASSGNPCENNSQTIEKQNRSRKAYLSYSISQGAMHFWCRCKRRNSRSASPIDIQQNTRDDRAFPFLFLVMRVAVETHDSQEVIGGLH